MININQTSKTPETDLKDQKPIQGVMLVVCIFVGFLSLFWYHTKFQRYHYTITSPLVIEIIFQMCFAYLIIFSFLGSIYYLLLWRPRILKATQNSVFLNLISNLTFCIYLVHCCVIETTMLIPKRAYTFGVYEVLGIALTDYFYSVLIAVLVTLCFELPVSSLWRTHADGWFLRKHKNE